MKILRFVLVLAVIGYAGWLAWPFISPFFEGAEPSVATERARWTLRRTSLSAQIESAETARSIATWLSMPVAPSPSPSLTIREKASTTKK